MKVLIIRKSNGLHEILFHSDEEQKKNKINFLILKSYFTVVTVVAWKRDSSIGFTK